VWIDNVNEKMYVKNSDGVFEEFVNKNKLDNYSLDEQIIGIWIDGKPLYRKVLQGDMPQVTTDGVFATTNIEIPDNLDFVFCEFAFFKGFVAEGNYVLPITGIRHDSEGKQFVTYNIMGNILEIRSTRSSWNNFIAYFSLLYTKTTD